MNLRCKPGDLAVIIGSDFPEVIGRFVTVIRRSSDEDLSGVLWECQPQSPMPAFEFVEGEGWIAPVAPNMEAVDIFDYDLRPITPPAGTISTDEVRELYDAPSKQKERTAINADLTSASGETVPGVAK